LGWLLAFSRCESQLSVQLATPQVSFKRWNNDRDAGKDGMNPDRPAILA
jgi:hypothetical protein